MSPEKFESFVGVILERRPFQVFTIEINGGKRFEVDHPHVFSMRDGAWHFWAPGGMPIWFDYDSVSHIFPSSIGTPTRNATPR